MGALMRIAMIGQRGLPARYGGIEHHVDQLSRRMVAQGHDVTVYCRPDYSPVDVDELHGIRLRHVPTGTSKHGEALVHSYRSTRDVLADGSFDVVHYHALGPGFFSPMARRGGAVVQTIHGLDDQRAKWGRAARTMLRAAREVSAWAPDETIVVSQALKTTYERVHDRASTYIPNAAPSATRRDADRIVSEHGLAAGGYVVWVGRIVPEKAPHALIEAFAGVETDLRLAIVGGSSNSDAYVAKVEDLAAQDERVHLLGYAYGDMLHELYSNAALFAFPSALEGLPLTVLEAAAYGLPMVLSDIPPHREIVVADRAGARLVPVDDVAALRDRLQASLDDLDGERRAAADVSVDVGRRYCWDRATEATLHVYARALDGAAQRLARRRRAARNGTVTTATQADASSNGHAPLGIRAIEDERVIVLDDDAPAKDATGARRRAS